MIQAVLFDCDGLMFETERISITMWKEQAEKYHISLPDDFFTKITGSSDKNLHQYLLSIPGLPKVYDAIHRKRFDLDFWKSCGIDTLNKKGLIEIFAYLDEIHMPRAICSSSPREYVETLLSRVSVPLHYDEMICGDMVKKAKPDPEIFLKGAEALDVTPAQCLVLEDSKAGILAAKRAGMHSCWIRDMIEADDEMKKAIEYREDSLLGVIDLLKKLNGEKR